MEETTPQDILTFWRSAGPQRWFASDPEFDAQVRVELFDAHAAAARGALDNWLETPDGALALILLLDQVPRNIFRGLARAFATDDQARGAAREAIESGFDLEFGAPLRRFFYLPAMHSENLADQDLCIQKCKAANDEEGVKFALLHRDIIARFGRFPHRNPLLGRATTPEEQAFLDAGGFAG